MELPPTLILNLVLLIVPPVVLVLVFRQTVVMIIHNDDIDRPADRIVRIEDGKIVE